MSDASTVRPPDRPRLPRPPRSRGLYVFAAIGTLVVALYGASALFGWEAFSPSRNEIPGTIRASPGGYRSYQYWHSGYHGGK